jgi:hypothetical protein
METTPMTTKQRVKDLEIHQDLDFQQRDWRLQRIGWLALGLVIIAMLLGLGGTGVLAQAKVGQQDDPLEVEYKRFSRSQSPVSLRLWVQATPDEQQTVKFWIDRRYLSQFQIEQVTPQPDSEELTPERLVYSFKVVEAGQPVEVTFHLKPTDFGLVQGEVGLPGQPGLRFSQFIYP